MKTRYKFINMEKIENENSWYVKNNRSGGILGKIAWYKPWRQYCFLPKAMTVFNTGCLDDIKHFIGQISNKKG